MKWGLSSYQKYNVKVVNRRKKRQNDTDTFYKIAFYFIDLNILLKRKDKSHYMNDKNEFKIKGNIENA